METKVNFAIVGAFVLLLGAALIGGVLWLSSEKSYRKVFDTYLVYMEESVSGLTPDAPVRYRGVQVGRVRKIALARGNIEKVQLTLDIERGTPIKEDTVAVLVTQGLTGIAHVDLSGGTRDAPALQALPGEDFPVIPSGPSLLARLDTAVTSLIDSVTRSSENVNALLDEGNRAALKETLSSLALVSRTLAARSSAIDAGVAASAQAMENTARLTGEMAGLAERIGRSAEAFERMSNEGARAAASAASAVEGARADLRQATRETIPETRQLIVELRDLTTSLRRFSDQLERNPAMLVHGKGETKKGPGE
jgi:phospholipid/cholesterol/gamma-HCH transport system substrate-binding protein